MRPTREDLAAVRAALARSPALRDAMQRYLDVVDRTGAPKKRFTFPAASPDLQALLGKFLGPAYCSVGEGRIVARLAELNAARSAAGLCPFEDLLYQAFERRPMNRAARRQAVQERALATLEGWLAQEDQPAVGRAFLEEQKRLAVAGRGELVEDDDERFTQVRRDLGLVLAAVRLTCQEGEPLRLSHLGRLVAGSTKAFRTGTSLLNRLADLLYGYDPGIRAAVDQEGPEGGEYRRNHVLEQTRLLRDGASDHFLVFGNLVYRRQGRNFSWIADHAGLGEPVRLTWQQWKGAEAIAAPSLVTIIENETSFLDHLPSIEAAQELVVCCAGQAGWGLIRFLKGLAGEGRRFRHWGDLDRSGILILNSLARRTGLSIEPWRMAPDDVARLANLGQPLTDTERNRIAALLEGEPRLAWDTLAALLAHGVWIEQENWADDRRPG